jgi:hypothetical protein
VHQASVAASVNAPPEVGLRIDKAFAGLSKLPTDTWQAAQDSESIRIHSAIAAVTSPSCSNQVGRSLYSRNSTMRSFRSLITSAIPRVIRFPVGGAASVPGKWIGPVLVPVLMPSTTAVSPWTTICRISILLSGSAVSCIFNASGRPFVP